MVGGVGELYAMNRQSDVQCAPSEQAKKKAQAAKEYIENMYRLQQQSIQERMERCVWLTTCRVWDNNGTHRCSHMSQMAHECCVCQHSRLQHSSW